MRSPFDASDSERERQEKIAAVLAGFAQLLMTLETLGTLDDSKMIDLFVQNITTLIDDAVDLAPHAPQSPQLHPVASPTRRRPLQILSPDDELSSIDEQIDVVRTDLAGAISNTIEAFKVLAAAKGPPDLPLLRRITAALNMIRTCRDSLVRLAHDRTILVAANSFDPMADPGDPILPTGLTSLSPGREHPSSISMFPPTAASPHNDDELRRGPRITGPGGSF